MYNGIKTDILCHRLALLGCTIPEMCKVLGISAPKLKRMMKDHPSLDEAIIAGRDQADGQVAEALYKRATGFVDPNGQYIPPDTKAQIWWLKNRQRDRWRDKHEVEHSGSVSIAEQIQAAYKTIKQKEEDETETSEE